MSTRTISLRSLVLYLFFFRSFSSLFLSLLFSLRSCSLFFLSSFSLLRSLSPLTWSATVSISMSRASSYGGGGGGGGGATCMDGWRRWREEPAGFSGSPKPVNVITPVSIPRGDLGPTLSAPPPRPSPRPSGVGGDDGWENTERRRRPEMGFK